MEVVQAGDKLFTIAEFTEKVQPDKNRTYRLK